jgi:hypothetical protein
MITLNQHLDIYSFVDYLNSKNFGKLQPSSIVIHQYNSINENDWKGQESYMEIKKYYETKGNIAGPHIIIANDGIWLFTDMYNVGCHSDFGDAFYKNQKGQIYKGYEVPNSYDNLFDFKLISYSIGILVVGNYENQKWQGNTKINALYAISCLQKRLNIFNNKIFFHREFIPKTCPGIAITKDWLFYELGNLKFEEAKGESDNKEENIILNRAKNIGIINQENTNPNKEIIFSCIKTIDYLERRMDSLENKIKNIEKKS